MALHSIIYCFDLFNRVENLTLERFFPLIAVTYSQARFKCLAKKLWGGGKQANDYRKNYRTHELKPPGCLLISAKIFSTFKLLLAGSCPTPRVVQLCYETKLCFAAQK